MCQVATSGLGALAIAFLEPSAQTGVRYNIFLGRAAGFRETLSYSLSSPASLSSAGAHSVDLLTGSVDKLSSAAVSWVLVPILQLHWKFSSRHFSYFSLNSQIFRLFCLQLVMFSGLDFAVSEMCKKRDVNIL